MSVVIFGWRAYGRVDAHGGEYAQTQFFHVQFMPLLPRSSFWVTEDLDGDQVGFPIKLHRKSIVATYLRTWGLVAAIAAFVSIPGLPGALAGAALAALSAWSWTWRSLWSTRARLRSDFRAVALGARCAPEHLTDEARASLSRRLRARWDTSHAGRAPDEVARYGTQDVQEAVLAYGLLSLAAVERGRAGAAERAAADRLVHGTHDAAPSADDGPYRATQPGDARTTAHATAAAVTQLAAARISVRRDRALHRRKPRWFQRPGVQLAGLGIATLMGIGSAQLAWRSLGPPRTVTARQLGSVHLLAEQRVAVNVDTIVDPGWALSGIDENKRVLLGRMGKHVLPILIDAADDPPGPHLVGRLNIPTGMSDDERWLDTLQDDAQLDAAAFDYYLDLTHSRKTRIDGVTGTALTATAITLWALWLRAWRARRRARAAA